jgi:hypothetical protein
VWFIAQKWIACMRLLALFVVLVLPMTPSWCAAEDRSWVAEKCAIYGAAWEEMLSEGAADLDRDFVAGNERFIASACTDRGEVCPVEAGDFEVANTLTLMLMNAGAASTFLPFRCPHPHAEEGGYSGPGL